MALPQEYVVAFNRLPPEAQAMLRLDYKRNSKSMPVAYITWFFAAAHYIYLRQTPMFFIYWLVFFGTFWLFFIPGVLWWLVDIFRIPGLVSRHNHTLFSDLLLKYRMLYPQQPEDQ